MGLLSFFISSHLIQGTVHAQIEVPSDSFQVFVKLFGRSFQFLRQFRNRAVLLITALQDLLIFGGDLANAYACLRRRFSSWVRIESGLRPRIRSGLRRRKAGHEPPASGNSDFKMYESTSPSVKGTTRIIIFVASSTAIRKPFETRLRHHLHAALGFEQSEAKRRDAKSKRCTKASSRAVLELFSTSKYYPQIRKFPLLIAKRLLFEK